MDGRGRTKRSRQSKVLEGLEVEGEYVRIDDNLIKRLKYQEPDQSEENDPTEALNELFVDCPEYIDLLGSSPITQDQIRHWSVKVRKNHWGKKMGEMISNLPLDYLALQRSALKTHNFEYRYKPSVQPRVTNQFHSGRCWLFASLNVLRYGMQLKHNLEHKFEFSASYLYFWDKIERANVFLEGIWSLRDKPLDDRYLQSVFTNPDSHMIQDGGYWNYFKNLVNKYGLVPKTIYNDSYNCLVSDQMNQTLIKVLNEMALKIREGYSEYRWTEESFRSYLDEAQKIIYDLVVKFMGEPPSDFTWTYKDAQDNYSEVKNLTPMTFFQRYVPHSLDTKMTFIHDPRHPEHYYKTYHVEYATNMIGAEPLICINLPLDELKKATATSQIAGEPCWFGCDVGACLDYEEGVMDTSRFDYKRVLSVDIDSTKERRMTMKVSSPTHAMVINGVDMEEPNSEDDWTYKKWRVENSWGEKLPSDWEPDHGYWQMSDDWFDQYVYMVVLDLKFLPPSALEQIMTHRGEKVPIKPWDVFGTVATHTGCNHCKLGLNKKDFKK